MSKTRKLDIKDVLAAIDNRDFDFYSKLSDEQKGEFSPFVIMQFLSGHDSYSLEMVQELINKNFSIKSKNHELFFKLCCVMGDKKKKFHPYTKPPRANRKKSESVLVLLLTEYRNEVISEEEAIMLVKKNSNRYDNDFWIMIAESLGWTKDMVSKLDKELKTIY